MIRRGQKVPVLRAKRGAIPRPDGLDDLVKIALRTERQLHRVVEAAATETLDVGAVGPATPDARSKPVQPLPLAGLDPVTMPAIGPVVTTIRPKKRAVDIAAIAVEFKSRSVARCVDRPCRGPGSALCANLTIERPWAIAQQHLTSGWHNSTPFHLPAVLLHLPCPLCRGTIMNHISIGLLSENLQPLNCTYRARIQVAKEALQAIRWANSDFATR